MSDDIAIRVEHVSKEYRLGMIGGTTLRADLQRLWAKMRGKEDPNSMVGTDQTRIGEKFLALDDVSFEVKKGEALGIIGHNGAGKSTLLKLLSRVTAPTKGKISYNGRIASMLEVGTGFHPELTGRENVYMNGAILGMRKWEIDKKFDEIVAFAEMEKFIDTPVKRYSSGMYVKLAFAVAAHLDAEIIIMDEVLAVGDMKFQQKCLAKMRETSHVDSRTVLFVSHNMNSIRQLCERCIFMKHGKLMYSGAVEDAVEKYLGNNFDGKDEIQFSETMHERKTDAGVSLRAIRFPDKNVKIVQNSSFQISIQISAQDDVKNIHIRFEIAFADGTIAGTEFLSAPFELKRNEKNELVCLFSTKGLMPGKYLGKILIFESNEFGNERPLDIVTNGLCFEIISAENAEKLIWLHQYWGHIRLEDAAFISISAK